MKIDNSNLPTTLEEAVDLIMASLTEQDKKYIDTLYAEQKKNFKVTFIIDNKEFETIDYSDQEVPDLSQFYFTLGMHLRNYFGLWNDTPLVRWFINNFKICHADDVSGIILEAFAHRYLNKHYDPSLTVERFHRHWRIMYGREDAPEFMIEEWKKNHHEN